MATLRNGIAIGGGLLMMAGAVMAQERQNLQAVTIEHPSRPSSVQATGSLGLEAVQYATDLPENSKLSQSQNILGHLRVEKSRGTKSAFDATASSNTTVGTSHFAVSELYAGLEFGYGSLYGGRKLENWSLLDSAWQLGEWQPNFGQIDALKPIDQGLTGFFLKQSHGSHELLVFATPVFIPSMGPDVQENNGNLVSDSRWYRQPSPTFSLSGVTTRVVYAIDLPALSNLVNNSGFGARYQFNQNDSRGTWFSANYGYKPINSLLLRYRTILKTPEVGTHGEVTVSPVVGYHTVAGADLGYRFDRAMVGVSYLTDTPQDKTPEAGWFQQRLHGFQAVGLHGEVQMGAQARDASWGMAADYIRITDGRIEDIDSNQDTQGALFENRFIFTNAASVKLEYRSHVLRKPASAGFKYLRDFAQQGDLVGLEMRLFPVPNWLVSVGADVLSVDDDSKINGSFLNQFRANDRYYGGLSYVF